MRKFILMLTLLAVVFTSQTVFAEETTTNTEFKDISWNEVSDVDKVKKIISRITILRMLGVVPSEFWKEFGLDLDKETIDWEKIDGIDLKMVLSAHEQITQEVEEQLNKNGSTLGEEEVLRAVIIASSLRILDYHIVKGSLVDEEFEPILDGDLAQKIKDRIADIMKSKVNPEDGINGDGLPTNSDSTSEFTDGYRDRISDLFSNFDPNDPAGSLASQLGAFGGEQNWQHNAGIGNDMDGGVGAVIVIGTYVVSEGMSFLGGYTRGEYGTSMWDRIEDGFDSTITGGVFNNILNLGNTRAEKIDAQKKQSKIFNDILNKQSVDGDGDGIPDSYDNNLSDGPFGDLDGDGILNNSDSSSTDGPLGDFDGDGNINSEDDDIDNDGLSNTDEDKQGSNNYDSDSDDDGANDKEENVNGTDPNNSDSKPDDETNKCNDGATDCGNNDNDTDNGTKKEEKTDTDECDRNPDDGSITTQGTGIPTSDDINNINNQNISGNGTTYIENTGGITVTEVQAALDRIEVIKTEYGIICNQDTGVGCSEGTGEYNDNPLKTGEAITNPGLLEK